MGHHSNLAPAFISKLETVIEQLREPLEKSLWENLGGNHDSPRQYILGDISAMIGYAWREVQITGPMGAFAGDVWDYADQISHCENAAGHKESAAAFVNRNRLLHAGPPTSVAWYLQQHDDKNRTKHLKTWINFLAAFAFNDLLSESHIPAQTRMQVLEGLKSTYGPICPDANLGQPAQAEGFASPGLIQAVKDALVKLEPVVETIVECAPELSGEQTPREWATSCVLTAIPYMANVDGVVSPSELHLMREFYVSFGVFSADDSIAQFGDKLQTWLKQQDPSKIMKLLAALRCYDEVFLTTYFTSAKGMLMAVAQEMFFTDGELAAQESNWLSGFKTHVPDTSLAGPKLIPALTAFKSSQPPAKDSIEDYLQQLMSLTGLDGVKQEVTQLINFLKVQRMREMKGLGSTPMSRHLVFLGNPGTGKTTVARIVSRIYKALGVLSKGHLVEADRASLVAGYSGQTALKVHEVVEKSLGGILFIDEAYSLVNDSQDAFGKEAIDTLLKLMEDYRNDLVVIVAGYTTSMQTFLEANPGLKSRFNKYITFADYNPDELLRIFERLCNNSGFHLSSGAKARVHELFNHMYARRDHNFGNGRDARNVFEKAITRQADRIVSIPNIDERTLTEITEHDIPGLEQIVTAQTT